MSDDIEINLDDPEDINIAVDDDSPISVELPEGGMDGRSIHPAGEWSDAVEYAYLDLVTHEGSSYTAVRAVPAGTELTDTYYWQLTAEKGDPGDPGTPEWGAITGDLSDQTDLADALLAKAPVILSNASGSIASFSDGSPAPVTALSVGIEPVQSGTGDPSPGTPITLPAFEQGTINGGGNLENSSTRVRTSDFFIANGSNYRIEFDADKVATVRVYSQSGNYSQSESITSWTASPISLTITNERKVKIVLAYPDNSNINTSNVTKCSIYENVNIRPISGWDEAVVTRTGKNLLDCTKYSTYIQYRASIKSILTNKIVADSGNSQGLVQSWARIDIRYPYIKGPCTVALSGKYINRTANTNSTVYMRYATNPSSDVTTWADTTNITSYNGINNVGEGTFSMTGYIPEGAFLVLSLSPNATAGSVYLSGDFEIYDLQVELGSSATEYEETNIQQVTIDLNGTRYGGVIDVLTGMMKVTHGYKTVSDLEWSYDTQYSRLRSESIAEMKAVNARSLQILCSVYKTAIGGTVYSVPDMSCYNGGTNLADRRICVHDSRYTDANSFVENMGTAQFVYELGTPITVTLTPSQMQILLGANNIWADTGDVAVTYRADTKLFIENLTKPTEDDMTANTNIAANTFFMVGNSLYYATSAIATGTTIVPGQNCTALSLAEALNNINA